MRELGDRNVMVFRDKASGMNTRRPGLARLLKAARAGEVTLVRVTHADRLTRFGFDHLVELFEAYGARVEVLHATEETAPEEELLQDFMSLIACFSGRMYGRRSAESRRRLLEKATGG